MQGAVAEGLDKAAAAAEGDLGRAEREAMLDQVGGEEEAIAFERGAGGGQQVTGARVGEDDAGLGEDTQRGTVEEVEVGGGEESEHRLIIVGKGLKPEVGDWVSPVSAMR